MRPLGALPYSSVAEFYEFSKESNLITSQPFTNSYKYLNRAISCKRNSIIHFIDRKDNLVI